MWFRQSENFVGVDNLATVLEHSNKVILLTGATGFLGSNLVKGLLKNRYRLIILKRSFSNTRRIEAFLPRLTYYDVDKCDLSQPFKDFEKIDAIIHTATSYGKNKESIVQVVQSNLLFPLRLLEIAYRYGVEVFFNTDTYFNKRQVPYLGLPNYSLSKSNFLEWGKLLASQQKIKFINIRLEHLFGYNDHESKFTTHVINSCLKNLPELNLTLGSQKRDFVYIDDVVSAYVLLLQKSSELSMGYQEYELGSGQASSIKEFVERVRSVCESQTQLNFGAIPYRPGEIMHSQANISPLKDLGWMPRYDLKQALSRIIDFYRENRNNI